MHWKGWDKMVYPRSCVVCITNVCECILG